MKIRGVSRVIADFARRRDFADALFKASRSMDGDRRFDRNHESAGVEKNSRPPRGVPVNFFNIKN